MLEAATLPSGCLRESAVCLAPPVETGRSAARALRASAPALATETLIVSDVHLGLRTSRPGKLMEVLDGWRFERLVLLGDILHDTAEHRFCEDSWRLLRRLRELARCPATELVWLEGNHDRHLAPWVEERIGVTMCPSYVWMQGGRSFLAVHGDRFDWFNHHFTRIGLAVGAAYAFAQHRLSAEGRWPKRLDRMQSRFGGLSRRVSERAGAFALAQGYDTIVCGHTHKAVERRFHDPQRGSIVYVNSGSWVDLPASFLTVDTSGVRINHAY